MKKIILFLLLSFSVNEIATGAIRLENKNLEINYLHKSGRKRQLKKQHKKTFKFFLKKKFIDPETETEKKKLPFGVIALLCLLGIPVGVLIGTGIGNMLIFIGWFMAVLFGLRGMKRDKNKFPALIALAAAIGLLISTFTFIEAGVF